MAVHGSGGILGTPRPTSAVPPIMRLLRALIRQNMPENSDSREKPVDGFDRVPTPAVTDEDGPAGEGSGSQSWTSQAMSFAGELLHVVVISLAIILPIRYFLIQPFYVKGASMEPNFYDHEYLIIDEISYRFSEPERGDIVVFRYPNDPRQYFIKRIIGLPGERIRIFDGRVMLYNAAHPDGLVLDEKTYISDNRTAGDRDVRLSDDEYFLLGDNRTASLDSRVFGAVPRRLIVGRVWLRGWPPEKLHVFQNPYDQENLILD